MTKLLKHHLWTILREARLAKFYYDQKRNHKFSFIHINKCGGTSVEKALGIPQSHDNVTERIERVGMDKWTEMLTFAIVRNPYTRVESQYRYRVRTNQNRLKTNPIDFNEWIERTYNLRDPNYYYPKKMFEPCYDWLTVDDQIMVKHILKLEDIEDDWQLISEQLALAPPKLQRFNTSTKDAKSQTKVVWSESSIKTINNAFELDFNFFLYPKLNLSDFS